MTERINRYFTNILTRRAVYMLEKYGIMLLLLAVSATAGAQESQKLTIRQAVELGLKNSKLLKLSQSRIDEAVSRYNQVSDNALPTASVSYVYNHAEIPTSSFKVTEKSDALHLPSRADAFLGTFSLQEVVFAGNKLRYAKESTDILTRIARLDADNDKDEIAFNIISAYINLYRLEQSAKIVKQNLDEVDKQIAQAQQFFTQGIITKNDVLRFQLQRSNIELTGLDIETNRKIVNYNLNILLGMPENSTIIVDEKISTDQPVALTADFIGTALANRTELKSLELRGKAADNTVKSLKAELKPVVLLGSNMYYINPSGQFIPDASRFIAPITLSATVAWNIDRLWTNKNKVAEAEIQRSQVGFSRDLLSDQIKAQVNGNYRNYLKSLDRIRILEGTIEQARENNRILESKYKNNVASVTDRIDAETQLYQSLTNLELAKADATLAYYTLLKSSGTITQSAY